MNEIVKGETFIGYEYLKRIVPEGQVSRYMDCLRCFGWQVDENVPTENHVGTVTLSMKRDRKLVNRTELTRLQRSFEDCVHQLDALERSKTQTGTVWALVTGLVGTAFMAGSTFAVTAEPPFIWLCVLLAIPGFLGWGLAPLLYHKMRQRRAIQLEPLIENKQEELYAICEKGSRLLPS